MGFRYGLVVANDLDLAAVEERHLADGAVTTPKLDDAAVVDAKLADLAVEARALADGAVIADKIGLSAVTTAALADLAVIADKIAAGAVGTDQLDALAVIAEKLADGAVEADKIAALAVGTAAIADAAIATAKIANLAVTTAKIANLAVDTAQIADAAIQSAKIANLAVGNAAIANLAVDDAKIANLDGAKIDALSISTQRLLLRNSDNLIQDPSFEAVAALADSVHSYAAGGGSWSIFTSAGARSGGRFARFDPTGMTGVDARVFLNGTATTPSKHVDVIEGEVYTFQFWATADAAGACNRARARIDFRDETGTFVSAVSGPTIAPDDPGWIQATVEATVPANVAYISPSVQILNDGLDVAIRVEDCAMRRKVGTLFIEDQAVDIDRLLEPVASEAGYGALDESGQAIDNGFYTGLAGFSFSVPIWAANASVMVSGATSCAIDSGFSNQDIDFAGLIAGSNGQAIRKRLNAGGDAHEIAVHFGRDIASPGGTINVSIAARSTISNTQVTHQSTVSGVIIFTR